MAQDFTTTDLLSSVRRRAMIPATDEALNATDLLALATEELQTYVMAFLVSLTEEFKVAETTVTAVSGTGAYALPARASGASLRDVLWLAADGTYVPIVRIEPEREHLYGADGGVPAGYVFRETDVRLIPTPNATGTLKLKYHRRPSTLVTTSACAVVSSINGPRTVVTTTATVPGTFVTGVVLDLVDNESPFSVLAMDATTTGTVSGTTVTFASALPATVAAGDYVCLAGESCVAQVPAEVHPLLKERTAQMALKALGNPKWKDYRDTLKEMRAEVMTLFTPRSKGSPRYLINRNGPGW